MTVPQQIDFSPSAYIIWAAMILLLPAGFLVSAFAAAALHECCHLIALCLFRVQVYRIEVSALGARILTAPLTCSQELICALAGPVGSLLCLSLLRFFPVFAFCGFVQGLYNLLPLYPMDGGRILNCILQLLAPKCADELCSMLRLCAVLFVTVAAILLFFRSDDPMFLLFTLYFLFRTCLPRKTPCKDGSDWVQYS